MNQSSAIIIVVILVTHMHAPVTESQSWLQSVSHRSGVKMTLQYSIRSQLNIDSVWIYIMKLTQREALRETHEADGLHLKQLK